MNDLARQSNTNETYNFVGVSFVIREQKPIRTLPGFSKANHRVPKICDRKAQDFVSRLGVPLITEDLDTTFQSLRRIFGFKRRELQSCESSEGFGTITTPYFLYSSSVFQSSSNPGHALWQRDISQIKKPELFASFANAFAETFDTVEFVPPGKINLEKLIDHIEDLEKSNVHANYDRAISYCQIELDDLEPKVRVTEDALQIVHSNPTSLANLLASIGIVQAKLIRFAELPC